jgi:hypothetical protein
MSKTFVVLGNARSGTTLATGMLRALGVAMDADYGPPDENAPKGFCESLDAHLINNKIFHLAAREAIITGVDSHWSPPTREDILAQRPLVEADIINFIAKFASKNELWGFKNPKTSLTIELFLPHLPNPHFIVTQRNPLTNAIACHELFHLPFDYTFQVVNYYNYQIANFYARYKYPTLFLNFEEIRNNPHQIAIKLAEFAQVEFNAEKQELIQEFVVQAQKAKPLFWLEQQQPNPIYKQIQPINVSIPARNTIQPTLPKAGLYTQLRNWLKKS